jgi:hypothetical protein
VMDRIECIYPLKICITQLMEFLWSHIHGKTSGLNRLARIYFWNNRRSARVGAVRYALELITTGGIVFRPFFSKQVKHAGKRGPRSC